MRERVSKTEVLKQLHVLERAKKTPLLQAGSFSRCALTGL
jgi:hypothetical protein